MKVSESSSAQSLSISKKLFVVARQFVFPPSLPSARRSAIASIWRRPLRIADGRVPEHSADSARCSLDVVHAFVAAMAIARLVTFLIQAHRVSTQGDRV